jgi:uncharacterized membrane protein
MKRARIWALSVLIMMFLSLSSCGCLGGGSKGEEAQVTTTTRTTTLGQELQDLDEAHKKGIISDEQYEKKKKELLKKEE